MEQKEISKGRKEELLRDINTLCNDPVNMNGANIKILISRGRNKSIVMDLLVYDLRVNETDKSKVDIKFATGLTEIKNYSKGTRNAIDNILMEIIQTSTNCLNIKGLEGI